MGDPADAAAQREEAKGGAAGQMEVPAKRDQGEVDIGPESRQIPGGGGQRAGLLGYGGDVFQQCRGAGVAVGVKGVTEAWEVLARGQAAAQRCRGIAGIQSSPEGFDPRGHAAMAGTAERGEAAKDRGADAGAGGGDAAGGEAGGVQLVVGAQDDRHAQQIGADGIERPGGTEE